MRLNMAIVAFWSNSSKPTGQTMSAVAMATIMGIEHNYKVLLLTNKPNDNSLELCFGVQSKGSSSLFKHGTAGSPVTLDSGIEGLTQMALSSRLTPDMITNYTKIVLKNRLEVIYGYKNRNTTEDELMIRKIEDKFKAILHQATGYYDMIFIDLEKGMDSELTKEILNIANVVVINTEQKLNMIDGITELNKTNPELTKKMILNIGRFDRFSKYNVKNISRYTGIKKNISAIPYNTLFFEASGEGTVADLLLRIRTSDPLDTNGIFIKNVNDGVEKIINKIQELQMRA